MLSVGAGSKPPKPGKWEKTAVNNVFTYIYNFNYMH